jgi:signal peptidase I
VPGDRVACCDEQGRVTVNGRPLDESYIIENSPLDAPVGDGCRSRRFDEVVVEPGRLFVMGDHRSVSQDSRCQGLIPIENVIGRAFVVVWPSSRWANLSVPPTFESVPAAMGAPAAPPAVAPSNVASPAAGRAGVTSSGVASPVAGRSGVSSSGVASPVAAPPVAPEREGFAVVVPIFASALFLARSRRLPSARQRRLRP